MLLEAVGAVDSVACSSFGILGPILPSFPSHHSHVLYASVRYLLFSSRPVLFSDCSV